VGYKFRKENFKYKIIIRTLFSRFAQEKRGGNFLSFELNSKTELILYRTDSDLDSSRTDI